jgi:hypothetical protein
MKSEISTTPTFRETGIGERIRVFTRFVEVDDPEPTTTKEQGMSQKALERAVMERCAECPLLTDGICTGRKEGRKAELDLVALVEKAPSVQCVDIGGEAYMQDNPTFRAGVYLSEGRCGLTGDRNDVLAPYTFGEANFRPVMRWLDENGAPLAKPEIVAMTTCVEKEA